MKTQGPDFAAEFAETGLRMSIQAYDPDMVEAPGVEALAAAGLGNLWRSIGRIWPLWGALTVVNALSAAAAFAPDKAGAVAALQTAIGELPWFVASGLAAGVTTGLAIRIVLGREKPWRPDGPLLAYAAAVTGLGVAGSLVAAVVQAPHGAGADAQVSFMSTAGATLVAALALLWVALRLTIWPVGRLVGYDEMSPGRSWRLMKGAVLRSMLAAALLSAPVFILNMLVAMLTQAAGPVTARVSAAPLASLMALLAASVAAEIYRARVVLDS